MEVKDKLSKLLSKSTQESKLDKKLATSCQQFFSQPIAFRAASGPDSHLENLKACYKPLNRGFLMANLDVPMETLQSNEDEKYATGDCVSFPTPNSEAQHVDVIPKPHRVLCTADKVELEWQQKKPIGPGLFNMGNTCFLNSVMQCLAYTPPLYNYIMSGDHKQNCSMQGFCAMCEFQSHCTRLFNCSNGCVKPLPIVQNLRAIAKHFRLGRQEDAHEFLRYFIDGLQKSCLHGHPAKLDPHSKATTAVHQIFGGYHRSQVKCLECMKTSDTFDPLLDMSLDIKNCNTVFKALQKSIKPDLLEGTNSYACPFCKKMTKAQKRFTLQKLPKVLTLQLKRFDFHSMFGSKVNKKVDFSEFIDMRRFMSSTQGPCEWYRVFAVLVHYGFSSNSGHYYCYVRNSNGFWYCMNDSQVTQVSFSTVLQQEAYLLFYIKDENYTPPNTTPSQGKPDPNFLSVRQKASAGGKEAAPHVSNLNKPTGIVPPSPQTTSSPHTTPSPQTTPSPRTIPSPRSKMNGSLVQAFSIPLRKTSVTMSRSKLRDEIKVDTESTKVPGPDLVKSVPKKIVDVPPRPVFVPRQIKTQGKPKLSHVESKNTAPKKGLPSIKLSHLTDEDDKIVPVPRQSSTTDTIPVADSIPPSKNLTDVPPSAKPSSPLGVTMDASSALSPPSGFVTIAKDLSTSPKVALVSPQTRPGGPSSKPVARVRPSPHITVLPDTISASGTTVSDKAATVDVARDDKYNQKSLFTASSPTNSKVDSTTSGDVTVSPGIYGPELPTDHVTTTQDHVTSTHTQDPCIIKSADSVLSQFDSANKLSGKQQKAHDHSDNEGGVSSSDQKWISLKEKVEVDHHRNSDSREFVDISEVSKLSIHSREKHSNKADSDADLHHKHKKTLGEFWKVHSKEKRDRDRELDKHFESEVEPLTSKKKKGSSTQKDKYHSHRKPSRSRSPSPHSRRSRSRSPPSHSRRFHSWSRSPHSNKHSRHHRPHSHRLESSSEKVKWKSQSLSKSSRHRRHSDKVKKSPMRKGNAHVSPGDDDVYDKKRRRDDYSDEKSLASQEHHKRHKLENPEPESVDKHVKSKAAPVLVWDASRKDVTATRWDGTRNGNSLEQLISHSSTKIGTSVKSWEGGVNTIDSCTSDVPQRQVDSDNWDAELDKGKVKKVRKTTHEDDVNVSNKFQELQTKKNSQLLTVKSSTSESHHHKAHHHHRDRGYRHHH